MVKFQFPNKTNINTWRRGVIWSLLGLLVMIAAIMKWAELSTKIEWWLFVFGEAVGCIVIIYKLHFLRENFRSAYAVIEIALAVVVISLVVASGLQFVGMDIDVLPGTPLIGSAASAIYFGVRAWDNLYQSEKGKGSKLSGWMELWTKNYPSEKAAQKKSIAYPWLLEKADTPHREPSEVGALPLSPAVEGLEKSPI